MTEPLERVRHPEVSFDDDPISGYVNSAVIYPSGVVVLKVENRGVVDSYYYPPHKAPVVKDA